MTFEFKDSADQKAFERWAFGEMFPDQGNPFLVWNSLHGDKLRLKADDLIEESLKKMYALYLEEKNESNSD